MRAGLAGTAVLTRFNLRRDRIRIPAWVLGITLVQVGGASGYPGVYPTEADRQAQAAVMRDNPVMRAMSGPGHGLDDYTIGAMMTNEYLGFMLIFAALMSVFIVVRHTRAEEETGRAELVRSAPIGRYAPLAAALITAVIANIALGLLVALGMTSLGIDSIDFPGSSLYGVTFTVVGVVFATLAAIAAQISGFSRAASGVAGATVGAGYLLRAVGDTAENGLSWLSPMGWAQACAPYVENTWWPLMIAVIVAGTAAAGAFALVSGRDTGSGLLAERRGPAAAARALGTPLGFAWRLHRSSLISWSVAMALVGVCYGSATGVIEEYADNDVVRRMTDKIGGSSLTDSWLSMAIGVLAIVCTIFSIIAALRPRREETSGRAESVLATSISRTRWVGTHAVIAALGGVLVLGVTGLGLGVGTSIATGDGEYLWKIVGATLAYAPALWVTAALAVAVFGLVPRLIGLAWGLLGYAVLLSYLGGLLDLPGWMFDVSPYPHIPQMPAAEFDPLPLVILTLIAAGLAAAGLAAFRRRDTQTA